LAGLSCNFEGGVKMEKSNRLEGKKILLVDDEPDVLNTLEELLPMCQVVKTDNFSDGKKHLESEYFDIAILDIMGVDGYELLSIAKRKNVIAVMLTAHALSPDHAVKSYKQGAASYLPKEEMHNVTLFLDDILEAKEKGKNLWWRWLERLEAYWKTKFGHDWQKSDKNFWDRFPDYE
jgi:CheY-like chemotaxis protein